LQWLFQHEKIISVEKKKKDHGVNSNSSIEYDVNRRNQEVRGVTHAVLLPHHHTTRQPTHRSKRKGGKARKAEKTQLAVEKKTKARKRSRFWREKVSLTPSAMHL
jgi:hypothetical protein